MHASGSRRYCACAPPIGSAGLSERSERGIKKQIELNSRLLEAEKALSAARSAQKDFVGEINSFAAFCKCSQYLVTLVHSRAMFC